MASDPRTHENDGIGTDVHVLADRRRRTLDRAGPIGQAPGDRHRHDIDWARAHAPVFEDAKRMREILEGVTLPR